MSYKNPLRNRLLIEASLLSQRVSQDDPFFKEIALMDISERKKYAILYAIKENNLLEIDLESLTTEELIEKVLMPVLQRVGQAKYKADPLTNLGFKVGAPSKSQNYKDDDDI